jgi:hypothetical protein
MIRCSMMALIFHSRYLNCLYNGRDHFKYSHVVSYFRGARMPISSHFPRRCSSLKILDTHILYLSVLQYSNPLNNGDQPYHWLILIVSPLLFLSLFLCFLLLLLSVCYCGSPEYHFPLSDQCFIEDSLGIKVIGYVQHVGSLKINDGRKFVEDISSVLHR